MHNFVFFSNESVWRKSGHLGLDQVNTVDDVAGVSQLFTFLSGSCIFVTIWYIICGCVSMIVPSSCLQIFTPRKSCMYLSMVRTNLDLLRYLTIWLISSWLVPASIESSVYRSYIFYPLYNIHSSNDKRMNPSSCIRFFVRCWCHTMSSWFFLYTLFF